MDPCPTSPTMIPMACLPKRKPSLNDGTPKKLLLTTISSCDERWKPTASRMSNSSKQVAGNSTRNSSRKLTLTPCCFHCLGCLAGRWHFVRAPRPSFEDGSVKAWPRNNIRSCDRRLVLLRWKSNHIERQSTARIPLAGGLVCRIPYTECKYGGPLGRPGTSSMEARPVSMSVAAFP